MNIQVVVMDPLLGGLLRDLLIEKETAMKSPLIVISKGLLTMMNNH